MRRDMDPRPPRNGLSLAAGAGGLDMGLMLAEPGFETRCWVEWDGEPRERIIAAQRAGYFAPAPIWDDVRTFDGQPLRGAIDTILAGYPCQPFSAAGKRLGESDERHLWPDIARIITEVGPRWVFLENVAGHVSLGAETVLRDLRGMGFTPAAGLFSAREVGAPHKRQRWFCVAYAHGRDAGSEREQRGGQQRFHQTGGAAGGRAVDDACCQGRQQIAGSAHGDEAQNERRSPEFGDESAGAIADVGHAARLGRGEGRAEPELRGGRDAASGDGRELADAGGAELERQQRRQRDEGGREEPDGYPALCGGAGLFPPGPGDTRGWSAVLDHAPDIAPAASPRDLKRAADHYAALVASGWMAEGEAQSRLRRMADGLAGRPRALRVLGNGVVPLAAAYAWRSLAAAHGLRPVDLGAEE